MAEQCGYTHEDLARRLGRSRTSVTESLALARDARRGAKISVGWPTFLLIVASAGG